MTNQKFSRKRHLVVPRQLLCYIASEMGYGDSEIARIINRDRTTVIAAKRTVLDALTYNTFDYVRVIGKFTKHLRQYEGSEILQYLD